MSEKMSKTQERWSCEVSHKKLTVVCWGKQLRDSESYQESCSKSQWKTQIKVVGVNPTAGAASHVPALSHFDHAANLRAEDSQHMPVEQPLPEPST